MPVSDEVDMRIRFVGRPVHLEIGQEARPVSRKPMAVKVRHWERECVVDANEGGDVAVEFTAEPFSKSTACPIPPWTGWGLNGLRRVGALGKVTRNPLQLESGYCAPQPRRFSVTTGYYFRS